MVRFNFNLAPKDSLEYLRAKGYKTSFHYDEIAKEAHHTSFTVAKMMRDDLLKDTLTALQDALKEGKNFKDFQKEIQPTLQKKGWWGKQDIVNPKTGEVKTINIGSSRLRHIYKTNMRVAYARARYKEQMKLPNSTYLRYVSEMLSTSRDSHKAIHNTVLPREHIFWDTNTPINDHGCKCTTIAISAREAKRQGLSISSKAPKDIASKDWAFNPAKVDNLDKVYDKKISAIKEEAFSKIAKANQKENREFVSKNALLYDSLKRLFTQKAKRVELCKSDCFGKEKSVYLSSDTVQTHTHHEEIGSFDYSLIPLMLEDSKDIFIQDETRYIIIKQLGTYYHLVLKNIKDKDEIFVLSLFNLGSKANKKIEELNRKYKKK